MLISGEKLNSSLPQTKALMQSRDESGIMALICSQELAGADFIDVNTAAAAGDELHLMKWIIKLILKHSKSGIMIDSADENVLTEALFLVKERPVIVNSITPHSNLEKLGPALQEIDAGVVCLPMEDTKTLGNPEKTLSAASKIVEKLSNYNIKPENIYMDILVRPVCFDSGAAKSSLENLKNIKKHLPEIKTIGGISNVSFGLPERTALNAVFISYAMDEGLDCAILDILCKQIKDTFFATNALLGCDEDFADYIAHARSV